MKNKNIFWGILLILAAVFIVIDNVTGGLGIEVGDILLSILFIGIMIPSLKNVFWPGVLIALGGLYLIGVKYISVLAAHSLSVWQVFAVVLLGSVGLSLLKPGRPKHKNKYSKSEQELNGQHVYIMTRFGEATRYVKSLDLKHAQIENSFGESSVYFDEVKVAQKEIEICISNSFGELNLYLPKEWTVINMLNHTFGEIKICGNSSVEGEVKVTLSGSTSFGEIKIIYI